VQPERTSDFVSDQRRIAQTLKFDGPCAVSVTTGDFFAGAKGEPRLSHARGPLGCTGSCWPPAPSTHQPDYATDFPSYANYVTTQQFLLSHLIGSIAGAAFGLIGGAALLVLAAQFAPQLAGWGFVTWTFAQVGLVSVFGVAAFFQPAIGRSFLRGAGDAAIATNEDVYGGTLFAVAGLSLLLFIAGAVMLGMAARRTPTLPSWAGVTFAASAVVFVLAFLFIDVVQPVAGLGIAAAGAGLGVGARAAAAEHLRPVDRRG
jgi:hypothetical protein